LRGLTNAGRIDIAVHALEDATFEDVFEGPEALYRIQTVLFGHPIQPYFRLDPLPA
jgi:hypothetical protein